VTASNTPNTNENLKISNRTKDISMSQTWLIRPSVIHHVMTLTVL